MDHFLTIKSVLDYIENRVAAELGQDEIAAAAGFSVPHLREIFRIATGQTLARYITRRRLCHAASELARTKRSIAGIALDYGFDSHDGFTRAFRRTFGENPSAFRANGRQVRGTLIVPGVFGPSVTKEDATIMGIESNVKDQGTLYGVVPKVSYFNKEMELTPFISCLRACLTYLGRDIPYARLLAASGAAFRLMWNLEYWDGGNVDILVMREDPVEPLRRAFHAAGWDYRLLCKPDQKGEGGLAAGDDNGRIAIGGKEDFIALIKQEIDAGRPLIGFGIIGPPEACLIAGYKDGGETLVGWNFFQDMPEYAGGVGKEPCGYYRRRGWYEHDQTIALMALAGQTSPPDARELLRNTLDFALKVMETPKVHTRAGGFAAFAAWADALRRESEFPAGAPLPMLMERLMCQVDAMTMTGERWYAAAFLEEQAEAFPAAGPALKAAAACFQQEHKLVMEMAGLLGGFGMGENQARNLARPEVRQGLAALIGKCAEADREAAGHLRKVLGTL